MSNKVFVISDLHFGHENMAIARGFLDGSHEHDKHLIESWNSVVSKKDTVWILGDITMEKSSPYYMLNLLNGIKNVVLGNHDRRQDIPELLKYVNSVCGMVKMKGAVFTHCPIHESELERFSKNVHGHLHEKFIMKTPKLFIEMGDKDERYINVCAEVVNYTPVLISEL